MCAIIAATALLDAPRANADPLQASPETLTTSAQQANARTGASFVVAPIPLSDPAIGSGLGFGAMALYHKDADGRPWTTGLGGFYADSSSWAVAIFHKAHFHNDLYRLTAIGGYGDFNLDFFGIGQNAGQRAHSVAMEEEGGGGLVDVLVRVRPHLYFGLRYRGAAVNTTFKTLDVLPPELQLPDIQLESKTSALGFAAEYDTRDSEYNPRRGLLADAQYIFPDQAFGGDFDYQRVNVALNGYHGLGASTVLAWRGSMCWSSDGAPFYDLCSFGAQNDLRGYQAGQYRDHAMFAVQTELRQHLFWRVGGTAFVGVGEVAHAFGDISSDDLLPAAGFGLRLEASKQYRINVSADLAVGDHSSGFYFYIGEAF
ncbi:MAG: BamA/TamA family outer membrane protein [Pseudomonadota bacterium]